MGSHAPMSWPRRRVHPVVRTAHRETGKRTQVRRAGTSSRHTRILTQPHNQRSHCPGATETSLLLPRSGHDGTSLHRLTGAATSFLSPQLGTSGTLGGSCRRLAFAPGAVALTPGHAAAPLLARFLPVLSSILRCGRTRVAFAVRLLRRFAGLSYWLCRETSHAWSCADTVFLSLGHTPKRAIAGSQGQCLLSVLKTLGSRVRAGREARVRGPTGASCCTAANAPSPRLRPPRAGFPVSSKAGDKRLSKCLLAISLSSSGKCLFLSFSTSAVAFCIFRVSFEVSLAQQDESPSSCAWFASVPSGTQLTVRAPQSLGRAKVLCFVFLKLFSVLFSVCLHCFITFCFLVLPAFGLLSTFLFYLYIYPFVYLFIIL